MAVFVYTLKEIFADPFLRLSLINLDEPVDFGTYTRRPIGEINFDLMYGVESIGAIFRGNSEYEKNTTCLRS